MGESRARVHLRRLAVRNPCTVDWNGMRGSDAVRFCGACKNNVYNLSEMSEQDVERLLARSEDVCVRYYYRADGTIVTSACPPATRRRPSLAAAGVASALAYTTALVGISAEVAGTDTGEVAVHDDGIKVAMGMRLITKAPSPKDHGPATKREHRKHHDDQDVPNQALGDVGRPALLIADETAPAPGFQMPVPHAPPSARVWPAALLALAALLGMLLTSWLAFAIATAGGAAVLARRRSR